MKIFDNILVALDLSEMDDTLIRYASYISEVLQVEKVYFVHNIKKYEISELFEEQLKDINLDEVIGDELNDKVQELYTGKSDWEVLISEDPNTESLINYIANKYNIQLALIGNKNGVKGSGVIPGKLLRLLKCDILSIPLNAQTEIKNLWACTDFSASSRKIFQVTPIIQKSTSASLKAVHFLYLPAQFSPYLPKESMMPKVEKHLQEKGDKYLEKLNYTEPVELNIISGRNSKVSDQIRVEANKNHVDMVMIADKGGNSFSSLLIGSVTEELFYEEFEMPLYIVK